MIYKYIGAQIKARRQKLNLTQGDLAEAANISLSFLGHIERGTRKLSVETLYKLAVCLNCSADDLLGILDSKTRKSAGALLALARELTED